MDSYEIQEKIDSYEIQDRMDLGRYADHNNIHSGNGNNN